MHKLWGTWCAFVLAENTLLRSLLSWLLVIDMVMLVDSSDKFMFFIETM